VLVGSNTPHSWITDELFNTSSEQIEVFVIQFRAELLQPLAGISEFRQLDKLMERAVRGIYFQNISENGMDLLLAEIETLEGPRKFLKLVELLDAMSEAKSVELLCSSNYKADYKDYHEERILKVCHYIHEHYKHNISIESLADIVAMNPSAFCRFFKRVLGKTAIEYINELRISHVCNQIQSQNIPVYQMAFDAGFSSLAHFNKQFKRYTGRTPKAYKEFLVNK
ncbi:MAG: AraC family transcriptional regulator, partial [Bacteroidota bacterium]